MMVFQAFIDESEDQIGTDIIVLAGYVATAEAWAAFSQEWEKMLPYGIRDKDGFHFKMAEMAHNSERSARVPAFYWIIEKHAILAIGAIVKKDVVNRALERIWIPEWSIDPGFFGNPYLVAWRALLDTFHISRLGSLQDVLPLDQKVDFIFDERMEKKQIISNWNQYVADKGEPFRKLFGATPRFEDDRDFLPLQAADFWAWWLRRWAENAELWRAENCDFGAWRGKRIYPKLTGILSVDDVVQSLSEIARRIIEPGRRVYDLGNPDWYLPEWPLGPVLPDFFVSPRWRR